jgi:hypothetical protein
VQLLHRDHALGKILLLERISFVKYVILSTLRELLRTASQRKVPHHVAPPCA